MNKKALLLAGVLISSGLNARLPLSYNYDKYRGGQQAESVDHGLFWIGKESVRVAIDKRSAKYPYLNQNDKIVTVTFHNGIARKYVLTDSKLYRLQNDMSTREFLEYIGETAVYLTSGALLATAITVFFLYSPSRSR